MALILIGTKLQSYSLSDKADMVNFTEHQENHQVYGVLECNVQLRQKCKENLDYDVLVM